MLVESPYSGLSSSSWESKTRELIAGHPLSTEEIYSVVTKVWDDIFHLGIGSKPFRIGVDMFPKPQIMGFFIHELVPLELEVRYPGTWRRDRDSDEKDIVFIPDRRFSIEIKTSSSARSIYGNRSYAQKGKSSKKDKTGYYLAINFEKFAESNPRPRLRLVRFGWIDHDDWLGQRSPTGQQARLSRDVEKYKLLALPL